MAHKLQELFHDFANKINVMNNTTAMTALMYVKKDFNSFSDEEKIELRS